MIWARLAAALFGLLEKLSEIWQRERDRQAGRDEQKVADLTKGQESERERKNVDTVVSAADPIQHARMLDRWKRR